MIKENQKALNRLYMILDAMLIFLSFALSYFVRFTLFPPKTGAWYPFSGYSKFLLALIPAYLIIYYNCQLYTPMRQRRLRHQFGNCIKANLIGIVAFPFLLYLLKENNISRTFIFTFFLFNTTTSLLFRYVLMKILNTLCLKGFNQKHILFVGYSSAAERYIDRMLSNPSWGYHIYGILDDTVHKGTVYRGIPVLGDTHILEKLLKEHLFDEIAITIRLDEYTALERLVSICEKSGVHTQFVPDYQNVIPTTAHTEDLDGLPVINIRNVPLSNSWNKFVKRSMDIVGALMMLVIFSIPMLIVAIIIKLTSKGPLIFSQVRIGLHNQEFHMYKFRSMEVQDTSQEKKAWTTRNDPRVTPIGKIIRKTSIDELPQIFNVLKGDMSLVGPRPERPFFVEKFKEEIPRYMIKHQVRPGITGWAQVNGYRGDTSIRKRIEHDLYYIENWTLGMDIKILFLTVFKGFINKNAY